jgi:1-acyl-sn-glycerol-3-phosphate acyltransferase
MSQYQYPLQANSFSGYPSAMNALFKTMRGLASLIGYLVNTVFWCIPLFLLALLKFLIPIKSFRTWCDRVLSATVSNWVAMNTLNQRLFSNTSLVVQGLQGYSLKNKYLVVANHQSWVDILVLQRIFHRQIPFLKFFIKRELRWFPVLGQAWWALDFPFMKRYSKKVLKKKPHLKGKDLEITRKACEKFKSTPVSIMNFVEGTRFSVRKHMQQGSPYRSLLKSKAGGISYVLSSMGDQLNAILDVTIVYPKNIKSFWAFVCGEVSEIKIKIRSVPITADLLGDYTTDRSFRDQFHGWLNELWMEKDRCIQEMSAS